MNMICKVLKIRRADVWQIPLIELGSFLFGFGIMAIILCWSEDAESSYPLGALFAFLMTALLVCFFGGLSFIHEYSDAVNMGRTRKSFVTAYAVVSILEFLVCNFAVYILYKTEINIYIRMGKPVEFQKESWGIAFWILLCIVLAIFEVAVQLFIGAVILRFGKKALWVLWALWMFICIAPGRVSNEAEGEHTLFGEFAYKIVLKMTEGGKNGVVMIILVVSVVLMIPSILILRKQRALS